MKRSNFFLTISLILFLLVSQKFVFAGNNHPLRFPDEPIRTITVDHEDDIWIGTSRNGIRYFDGVDWTSYTTENGLNENVIRTVATVGGEIWVGHATQGISIYNGGIWRSLTAADGLRSNHVSAIALDQNGVVWIGHSTSQSGDDVGGISLYDNGSWAYLGEIAGISSQNITAIRVADNGDVWVTVGDALTASGLQSGGVARFDGNVWTSFNHEDGLASHGFLSLMLAEDSEVWVGGNAGISHYQNHSWANQSCANGLIQGQIVALAMDNAGTIWAGTERGIQFYDGTTWVSYQVSPVVDAHPVFTIAFDPHGIMWVGGDMGLTSVAPHRSHQANPSPQLACQSYLPLLLK